MGLMRFRFRPDAVPPGWAECAEQAYLSGYGGCVYPTEVEVHSGLLVCRRVGSESAKLSVAWPVEGFGCPVLTTSTLGEREEPYDLALELARGEICELRNQLATWESLGLATPSDVAASCRRAQSCFVQALTAEDEGETERLVAEALQHALSAAQQFVQHYASQRLAAQRARLSRPPALLGVRLQEAAPQEEWTETVLACSHAVGVSCFWPQVEPVEGEYRWELFDEQIDWCERHGLNVVGGPLLDFSESGVPKWLKSWAGDFVNLRSFLSDYVETALSRYVGRIRVWEVAGRLNVGGALGLSGEDRVTLVAGLLRVARQVDEEALLYVGVVQPWGEYMARGEHRFGPLDFADALLRFGLGLSGINLEVNFGYRRLGTLPRDLLDFSRLVDTWSRLEVPLHVTISFPGCTDVRSEAVQQQVWPCPWGDGWSEPAQAEWLDQVVALLMAKPSVVGVFWGRLVDPPDGHPYPGSGLVRPDGTPKPALERLGKHKRLWA